MAVIKEGLRHTPPGAAGFRDSPPPWPQTTNPLAGNGFIPRSGAPPAPQGALPTHLVHKPVDIVHSPAYAGGPAGQRDNFAINPAKGANSAHSATPELATRFHVRAPPGMGHAPAGATPTITTEPKQFPLEAIRVYHTPGDPKFKSFDVEFLPDIMPHKTTIAVTEGPAALGRYSVVSTPARRTNHTPYFSPQFPTSSGTEGPGVHVSPKKFHFGTGFRPPQNFDWTEPPITVPGTFPTRTPHHETPGRSPVFPSDRPGGFNPSPFSGDEREPSPGLRPPQTSFASSGTFPGNSTDAKTPQRRPQIPLAHFGNWSARIENNITDPVFTASSNFMSHGTRTDFEDDMNFKDFKYS